MSRFIFTFIIFFLVWLGFTTSFDQQELLAGAVISLLITILSYKTFTDYGLSFFQPKKLFNIVKFIIVFLIALIKSNFDVARRVINPKLPINPGIVAYHTNLKSDTAKVFLANAITLTPGTLSVDIIDNILYIHWIDVISKDPKVIFDEIGADFERILKEIFE
ncbi:Na(+) H(+) antiporter subunit E [hydrothermal vent metagenome]|uniref:Na(+) H(+) antiporter subunit E n=1 Tax=hydrothermal vent metagenome TaxID=652676 RepID=A0A3B1CDI7_9ZZZZ